MAPSADWAPEVQLVSLDSPYREALGIRIDYIKAERRRAPDDRLIVAVTEVVPRCWYQEPLHNQTAIALAASLRHVEGVTFGLVPFQLK